MLSILNDNKVDCTQNMINVLLQIHFTLRGYFNILLKTFLYYSSYSNYVHLDKSGNVSPQMSKFHRVVAQVGLGTMLIFKTYLTLLFIFCLLLMFLN